MERRYVGIDLHRRRSVIFIMDGDGQKLSCVRVANEPVRLLWEVSKAGDGAEVVVEATCGGYWAVDVLQDNGFNVHLAHPVGNDRGKRRVKNDERDARDLADLLRLGRLAEARIAPRPVRELRELVRYRAKLVQLRTGLKAPVHAVMAKEGVLPRCGEMFGVGGNAQRVHGARRVAGAYPRAGDRERGSQAPRRSSPGALGAKVIDAFICRRCAHIGSSVRVRSARIRLTPRTGRLAPFDCTARA